MEIIDLTKLFWIEPKYNPEYQKRLSYQTSTSRILSIFSLDDLAGGWGKLQYINLGRQLLDISRTINIKFA